MQIPLSVLFTPLAVQAVNIVLSNDDGWAEKNIRVFYDALSSTGESVIISAPADNRSGTGSSDATPGTVTSGCQFNSCPAGSPPYGPSSSNSRFNYVNSYPVTAMRYGIQTLSPKFFGGAPDIAVAGYNVGANLGSTTLISGTVGAATEAALEGIPAIAFSGTSGSQVSYTTTTQTYQTVYAQLSTNVTTTLVDSGKPYLPDGIWLNVNYPTVSSSTCSSASRFKFVLSRINSASSGAAADVRTCGSTRLPTESSVVGTSGCYASISVGVASNKKDATAAVQAVVLAKLQPILSCLP
ncbi:acid phosphatase precursor [Diaporthe sp. PMI_573]|nr:acid phosphatase precursor [Diaporthaceae sp. PMI_573]